MFRCKKDEGSCRIENETGRGFSVREKHFGGAERNNNTYGISNPDMRSISLSPIAGKYFGLLPCWSVAQYQQTVLQLPQLLRKRRNSFLERMASSLARWCGASHAAPADKDAEKRKWEQLSTNYVHVRTSCPAFCTLDTSRAMSSVDFSEEHRR